MKGIRHRDIAVLGQSESRIELCVYSLHKIVLSSYEEDIKQISSGSTNQ